MKEENTDNGAQIRLEAKCVVLNCLQDERGRYADTHS